MELSSAHTAAISAGAFMAGDGSGHSCAAALEQVAAIPCLSSFSGSGEWAGVGGDRQTLWGRSVWQES